MIIFINNNSTKFCQITLHIRRFIHKGKVVPFCASRCIFDKEEQLDVVGYL